MSLPIGEKQIVQKALNAAQTMVRQASDHEDLKHKDNIGNLFNFTA